MAMLVEQQDKSGEHRVRHLTGLSLAHFIVDGFATSPTPLLSLLAPALGVSYAAVSLLVGLNGVAAGVANIVFGFGVDRWRKLGGVTTVLAAALTVVCMSLIGVIPHYWVLGAVMLVGMFGCGGFHPPAFAAAGEATYPHRHHGVSVVMATGIAACGLGPVFVSQVVHRGGLRATPWCAIPGLALVALAAFLLRDARAIHEPVKAAIDLQTTEVDTGGRSKLWIALLFLNAALRAFAHMGVVVIVSFLSEEQWGLTVAASGWAIGSLQVGSGLGGLVGARLTATGRERRTLLWSTPVSLALLVPMAVTTGGSWVLWLFFYGLAVNGPGAIVVGLAQRLAPRRRALVSGLLVGPTFAVGAALASVSTPLLISRVGQASTMAFLTLPLLLSWVAAWALPADLADRPGPAQAAADGTC